MARMFCAGFFFAKSNGKCTLGFMRGLGVAGLDCQKVVGVWAAERNKKRHAPKEVLADVLVNRGHGG